MRKKTRRGGLERGLGGSGEVLFRVLYVLAHVADGRPKVFRGISDLRDHLAPVAARKLVHRRFQVADVRVEGFHLITKGIQFGPDLLERALEFRYTSLEMRVGNDAISQFGGYKRAHDDEPDNGDRAEPSSAHSGSLAGGLRRVPPARGKGDRVVALAPGRGYCSAISSALVIIRSRTALSPTSL